MPAHGYYRYLPAPRRVALVAVLLLACATRPEAGAARSTRGDALAERSSHPDERAGKSSSKLPSLSPRGTLTQQRSGNPSALLPITTKSYRPLLYGGRRNFHLLLLWTTPQRSLQCKLCAPLTKEISILADVHAQLRAGARANHSARLELARQYGSLGGKDLFFGVVELGANNENEELFRTRNMATVPVLELFKATSNTSKATAAPTPYPLAEYGYEARAIASFMAAQTDYGVNIVAPPVLRGVRGVGTPDWWDVRAMGVVLCAKVLLGAVLGLRIAFLFRRQMQGPLLLAGSALCWFVWSGKMYFLVYGDSASLLAQSDYGIIMSAESIIMAVCIVFVTYGLDFALREVPRWKCLRCCSRERKRSALQRTLYVLLTMCTVYIVSSHLMYAHQWAEYHRWPTYPYGAGHGVSLLNMRATAQSHWYRLASALRGMTSMHIRDIHPNFHWVHDTVWFWNDWSNVVFNADGSFSAPTDDCVANPAVCRWSADEHQMYIRWGDAGLHTVTPSRVLAVPGTLLQGRRYDGDACHASFVRAIA